jgi:hypothetical protein
VDDSEVYVNRLSSGQAATIGVFCSKEALYSAGAIRQTPDKARKAQLLFNINVDNRHVDSLRVFIFAFLF